jgi:predicted transcriptional regulator YheO
MANAFLPIPEHFSLEWYLEQKKQKKNEYEVAASLFICKNTLQNWKRQVGWTPDLTKQYRGRQPYINERDIEELRKLKWTIPRIAVHLDISECSVKRYIKQIKEKNE